MHLNEKIEHELYEELLENFILLHKNQFESIGLPEIYWRDLCMKLKDEIFDAGIFFQIRQRVDEDDNILGYKAICIADEGLQKSNSAAVFLIDHAWTYHVNEARKCLRESESLLDRMCDMMHINVENVSDKAGEEARLSLIKESKVNAVYEEMWKYNQTYRINSQKITDEDREPIWYVMDEFGSSIRHNDSANVRCAPFLFVPSNVMFSIMWLVEDVKMGEEITRDYAHGVKEEKQRLCKLLPWNEDIDDEDYEFDEGDPTILEEPKLDYFMDGRKKLILANSAKFSSTSTDLPADRILNVFTDFELIKQFLSKDKFNIVDDIDKADIRWISQSCKDYQDLQEKFPKVLINQFAYEENLTCKDMLAVACRRVESSKDWLPITYDLNNELSKFITYWKQREDEELDNLWILKPWNLSRSIDMKITRNLNQIIRSIETGPKIACKYIENPVLFHRDDLKADVKFDLRYYVLLKSVQPLKMYSTKLFMVRFANKQFILDDFDDYERHFTTMNYRNYDLKDLSCEEFVKIFGEQYSSHKWSDIQEKCNKMMRHVFEGATLEGTPKGLAHNPQSRALYGVDVMLKWYENSDGTKSIEPVICEVNYMPDCKRTCISSEGKFFDDIFKTLFVANGQNESVFEI